jgi:hypothetical protein
MSKRLSHLLVVAVLANARVAAAQGEPTVIPVPLATALLSGAQSMGISGGQFHVGTLPPAWRAELVAPPPAVVVGGLAAGSHLVAVFNDTTKRFLAGYLEFLQTKGFKPPPRPPQMGGFGSGIFQPTFTSGYLCRDSSRVAAVSAPGATRGGFILVDFQRMSGQCMPGQHHTERVQASFGLVLPVLTPPPGLEIEGTGNGGGSNSVESSATIRDSVTSVATIAAHYANLLVAAGWTADEAAVSRTALVQTVHATGKNGKPWDGILMVVATANSRQLRLLMTRRPDGE